MLALSRNVMKGQIGHMVAGITFVAIGVHDTKSPDASITFVQLAWPWTWSKAPWLLENSVMLMVGRGTSVANTFVWVN